MMKSLITLLFPALAAAASPRNLDFELLGPEAYRFETPATLRPDEDGTAPAAARASGILMESGLGLAAGAALAVPMALYTLEGDDAGRRWAAGTANVLGSAAGIWVGGMWMGRGGNPFVTLAGTVAGQAAGMAAASLLSNALSGNSVEQPVAFAVSFALPTALGVLGYNLSDR